MLLHNPALIVCVELTMQFSHPLIRMALGAGANVRARELEAPCSNPVEVALADLFHFAA